MADATGIEWADSTFNGWIGCTKVSPACDNCYAAVSTPARTKGIEWGAGKPRQRTSESNWHQPVKWNGKEFFQCASCGWRGEDMMQHQKDCAAGAREMFATRRRVFCSSLADVFDNEVDPQWRADLFRLIRATPNLDWIILTKRIGNASLMIERALKDGHLFTSREPFWPWPNVWLGITICNQQEADRDIPKLLQVPARIRFLSIEPMLGPVDLTPAHSACPNVDSAGFEPDTNAFVCCRQCDNTGISGEMGVDWIICGGESGHNARPMHPEWVRSLRDQCEGAGVPFLFKQWGEWRPPLEGEEFDTSMGRAQKVPAFIVDPTGTVRCFHQDNRDGCAPMLRVGKKRAGRLLDGRTWDQYPAQGGA